MGIANVFKKNNKATVQEVEAPVIETKTQEDEKKEVKEVKEEPKPEGLITLEVTQQELIIIGKALETAENTQLFYRMQEGIDNNNLLAKLVEKMPKE